MKFHISRWAYWWGYTLVLLLIAPAIWIRSATTTTVATGSIATLLFVLFEILIRAEEVIIGDKDILYQKGIFSKKVTRVVYGSISDFSVRQTMLQRIMGYGDVDIDTAGKPEIEIVLRGFQNVGMIESMVTGHIHKHHALKF